MAYCPKCSGVMEAAAVVCPHCGYDFAPNEPEPRRGIAYSGLANLALMVGILAAGLGCAACVIVAGVALLRGELLIALILAPLAFLHQLAMWVVYVRVQRI